MPRRYALDPRYSREIASRRRAARLSQLDLALALDCSESLVSKWERQAVPIPPHMRVEIDRVLSSAEQPTGCRIRTPRPM